MGISNIAINTFNSSSSQSLTRSIEADKTKRITSDFITPEPMSYINGSGISAINGTLKRLPAGSAESGYTDIFYIPNTIDAIKEILLDWKIKIPVQEFNAGSIYYSKTLLLDAIRQIEIKQGSVVVQTIFPGDIYMRNYSELGYLTKNEDTFTFEIKVDKNIIAKSTFSGNWFPTMVRYQVNIKPIIPNIIEEITEFFTRKDYQLVK